MFHLGYKLSSEEFGPSDLIQQAARAEAAGFDFALISDHFHPWSDRQGQSPFVWSVLGGIASVTKRLSVGTGVTCPRKRTGAFLSLPAGSLSRLWSSACGRPICN